MSPHQSQNVAIICHFLSVSIIIAIEKMQENGEKWGRQNVDKHFILYGIFGQFVCGA